MREPEAELLLEDRAPFSYVLRRGEQQYAYFITFMTRDGTIKHRRFVLDLDRKKWCYQNKEVAGSKEIFSATLDRLIPLMMECKPQNCIPH
jgi:hypothetical protein